MGFGFAAGFIVFLVLAIIFWQLTKNIWNGIILIGLFIVVKTTWRLLTQ